MDNVTHALAGMLMAEAVCVARRGSRASFRAAAYLTAALANNLPDIDPVYTWITSPKRLGSLLHHRGHTHTLVLAVPAGILLAMAVLAWIAKRRGPFDAVERRWVIALGAVGAATHIGMDFGNNYGVHPFWPFNSSWFYGDTIFIVEPLWWAVAMPALAFAMRLRVMRVVLGALLVLVLGVAFALPFITKGTAIAMVVLAAVVGAVSHFGSPRVRIATAWSGVLVVAATFVVASSRAEAVVRRSIQEDYPGFDVRDVATTPMPGNPLCWSALSVATRGNDYVVLSANVAPFPTFSEAAACPYDRGAVSTAPTQAIDVAVRPELRWLSEYRTPLDELRAFAQNDCLFNAFLLYARVPYLTADTGGRIAGDLRYDRSPDLDFADLPIPRGHERPRWLPGWTPPRRDVFGP